MSPIPHDRSVDGTPRLLADPYRFASRRCARLAASDEPAHLHRLLEEGPPLLPVFPLVGPTAYRLRRHGRAGVTGPGRAAPGALSRNPVSSLRANTQR